MTEQNKEPVERQCGTCKFAAAFDITEDNVRCTSEAQAKMLDKQSGSGCYIQEYKEYGFLSLWRLESIAEPSFRCANWQEQEDNKK